MEDIKFQSSMPKEIVPTLVRSQYRIKLYQHIAVRNAVPFPFNIYNNDNNKTKPQQSQKVNDIRLGCEVILGKNCFCSNSVYGCKTQSFMEKKQ